MQSSIPTFPHSWQVTLWLVLAAFLGGGGIVGAAIKCYTLYVNRKKRAADTHVSLARAAKEQAEAIRIDVQTDTARFDLVERLMGRLDECHGSIERLRNERDELRQEVDKQRTELEFADFQLQRMSSFIKMKGLHYSEMDKMP